MRTGKLRPALSRIFNQLAFIVAFGRSQKGLLMKPQIVVIAFVLIAGGASLSAVAEWPVTSERPVAVAEFDFTALHRQASDALDNLRRAQEARRASAGPAAF